MSYDASDESVERRIAHLHYLRAGCLGSRDCLDMLSKLCEARVSLRWDEAREGGLWVRMEVWKGELDAPVRMSVVARCGGLVGGVFNLDIDTGLIVYRE